MGPHSRRHTPQRVWRTWLPVPSYVRTLQHQEVPDQLPCHRMERLDPLQPFLRPRHSLSHPFHPQAEPIWRQPWTVQHLAPEPELPDQDLPSSPSPWPPSPSPPSPWSPSPWPPSSSPLVGPSPPSRGRHGDSEGV